jgi:hypothetical protein
MAVHRYAGYPDVRRRYLGWISLALYSVVFIGLAIWADPLALAVLLPALGYVALQLAMKRRVDAASIVTNERGLTVWTYSGWTATLPWDAIEWVGERQISGLTALRIHTAGEGRNVVFTDEIDAFQALDGLLRAHAPRRDWRRGVRSWLGLELVDGY